MMCGTLSNKNKNDYKTNDYQTILKIRFWILER